MKKTALFFGVLILLFLKSFAHDGINCSPSVFCESVCPDANIILETKAFTEFFQAVTLNFDTVIHNGNSVALDSFVITSITGLPNNMDWHTDCGTNTKCFYFPGSTCIIFGGVAVEAGEYKVSIQVMGYSVSTGGFLLPIPTYTLNVTQNLLNLSVNASETSSFGLCDGSAKVKANKGAPPYTYLWSSGETTDVIMGKCSDKYIVEVKDSLGVKELINAYISEPSIVITKPPQDPSSIVDTIVGIKDTCVINCDYPIDSAVVTSYELLDSTHAIFYFTIFHYQNGNRINLSAIYNYRSEGTTLVVLQINCSGTFSKMLKTCYVEDEIYIDYSLIGVKQILVGENRREVKRDIKVAPNPFYDKLYLTLEEPETVIIYYFVGNVFFEEKLNYGINIINTNLFPAVVYFLKFTNGSVLKTLIKN